MEIQDVKRVMAYEVRYIAQIRQGLSRRCGDYSTLLFRLRLQECMDSRFLLERGRRNIYEGRWLTRRSSSVWSGIDVKDLVIVLHTDQRQSLRGIRLPRSRSTPRRSPLSCGPSHPHLVEVCLACDFHLPVPFIQHPASSKHGDRIDEPQCLPGDLVRSVCRVSHAPDPGSSQIILMCV
nr:hypothetical protein CFP56_54351 [Quercus suber]